MTRAPSLKTRALGYLARREHSRLELEKKLAPHAETPEELSSVLDGLEQRGFLSAARLVEQIMHMRKARFGSLRIVQELREKGIEENLITAVLPDLREAEQRSAYEVWRKKFGAIPADAKAFGRQTRFLLGRGFRPEVVRRVLQHSDKEEG
ncbi:regulatory protein [Nitrosospira multiformis]|uniref:Regulatory protein RecX n=1 Tax=Nitrosospira multiformis TaxID=1231 RepID=A0A1I0GLF7_9PROT|nr:recombination regulator RecX [Nitrosospira multiformis]SET71813.1 regulatory protein [Nitrosospira multiformis]